MELTFNQEVGASEVAALLSEAAKDDKIGDFKVLQVQSDGLIESKLLLHYNSIWTLFHYLFLELLKFWC